jgi:pantothenate kinase, type III
MNLVMDIGNTRVKVALFLEDKVVFSEAFCTIKLKDIKLIEKREAKIDRVIFSVVGKQTKDIIKIQEYLEARYSFVLMNSELNMPLHNCYATPNTLGNDRLACIVAACTMYPKHNCLVIDAGSCITMDFIDQEGDYLGGSIDCGINMKYRALHNFTAHLPLLEGKIEKVDVIGKSTKDAIISGIINGTIMTLRGFIAHYKATYSDLKILITGGDALYLYSYLKEETTHIQDLCLQGLNIILNANK